MGARLGLGKLVQPNISWSGPIIDSHIRLIASSVFSPAFSHNVICMGKSYGNTLCSSGKKKEVSPCVS